MYTLEITYRNENERATAQLNKSVENWIDEEGEIFIENVIITRF